VEEQQAAYNQLAAAAAAAGEPAPAQPPTIPIRYAVPFDEAIALYSNTTSKKAVDEYQHRKKDFTEANYRLYFAVVTSCKGDVAIENFIRDREAKMSHEEKQNLDGISLFEDVCKNFTKDTAFEIQRRRTNLAKLTPNGKPLTKYMAKLEKEVLELESLGVKVNLDDELVLRVRNEMAKDSRYRGLQDYIYFTGSNPNWATMKALLQGVDIDMENRKRNDSKPSGETLNSFSARQARTSKTKNNFSNSDFVSARAADGSTHNSVSRDGYEQSTARAAPNFSGGNKYRNNYTHRSTVVGAASGDFNKNKFRPKRKFKKFTKKFTKSGEAMAKFSNKSQYCYNCRSPGHNKDQCPIKAPQALTISVPGGFRKSENSSQLSPFSDTESNNHTLLVCQRIDNNNVNINTPEVNNLEVGFQKFISKVLIFT